MIKSSGLVGYSMGPIVGHFVMGTTEMVSSVNFVAPIQNI